MQKRCGGGDPSSFQAHTSGVVSPVTPVTVYLTCLARMLVGRVIMMVMLLLLVVMIRACPAPRVVGGLAAAGRVVRPGVVVLHLQLQIRAVCASRWRV